MRRHQIEQLEQVWATGAVGLKEQTVDASLTCNLNGASITYVDRLDDHWLVAVKSLVDGTTATNAKLLLEAETWGRWKGLELCGK